MNHVAPITAEQHSEPSQMYRNLFSLARTQKRLAHEAKRHAMNAEADGNRPSYLFWRSESDRLWRGAHWAISCARNWR